MHLLLNLLNLDVGMEAEFHASEVINSCRTPSKKLTSNQLSWKTSTAFHLYTIPIGQATVILTQNESNNLSSPDEEFFLKYQKQKIGLTTQLRKKSPESCLYVKSINISEL